LIIDVHAHFWPEKLLNQFRMLGKYGFELRKDSSDNFVLYRNGKVELICKSSFYIIDKRLEEMQESKIGIQTLSLAQPGVFWAEPELALLLSQIFNDEVHEIIKKHPNNFIGIASVPLQDGDLAITELNRSIGKLGFKGVLIGTNVNGVDLDAPQFYPFFQRAEELGIPVFIHPFTRPSDKDRFSSYRLEQILGFMFENSIAISKVIFSGLLERYPTLKLCFAHLGGTIPYIKGRIDRGYEVFAQETRTQIAESPSFYLNKIYLDTAYFYNPALICALSCIPKDKLVFGTDHPFNLNCAFDQAVMQIQQASISQELKQKILFENTSKLLGI